MERPLVAVVMAGGTGTRLYPAARPHRPKQFLSFGAGPSLLARTVARVGFADEVFVSTRPSFADAIADHAPGAEILVEPAPRDTGPALVYAAHRIRERFGECVLLCVPSDHLVDGPFEATVRRAAAAAVDTDGIVVVGVEPDRPATEYGYVEPGAVRGGHLAVDRFREKPDAETAAALVDDGALWNAGLFAVTPEAFLREARETPLAPLVAALEAGDPAGGFAAVDPVSVDYAVLERTARAYVVPAAFAWDDLGSWDAVGRHADGPLCESLELDASGNVLAGDAHITVVGVDDLVVAAYDDRVLVVPKAAAQRVREAVARLREGETR